MSKVSNNVVTENLLNHTFYKGNPNSNYAYDWEYVVSNTGRYYLVLDNDKHYIASNHSSLEKLENSIHTLLCKKEEKTSKFESDLKSNVFYEEEYPAMSFMEMLNTVLSEEVE